MNKHVLRSSILIGIALSGCSRDYAPDAKSSGEEIYQAACVECHAADEKGIAFTIDNKNKNATYIAHKGKSGSIRMPSFPNIKATDMKKLTTYVLEHSNTK